VSRTAPPVARLFYPTLDHDSNQAKCPLEFEYFFLLLLQIGSPYIHMNISLNHRNFFFFEIHEKM
jgi:hypothetical protein